MTDLPHAHEASLETSLDFINTLEFSRVAPTDHLPDAAGAAAWLSERGLAHAQGVRVALDDAGGLGRLRSVRSALREIAEAAVEERAADEGAIREVNRALRARSVLELVPAPDGITLGHRHVGDPLDDALATLIEPVVREIAAGRRDRLRICADDSCRWVFFDGSRTGTRRWCDMSTCGNRAKAARHRARLRTLDDQRSSGAPERPGAAWSGSSSPSLPGSGIVHPT